MVFDFNNTQKLNFNFEVNPEVKIKEDDRVPLDGREKDDTL